MTEARLVFPDDSRAFLRLAGGRVVSLPVRAAAAGSKAGERPLPELPGRVVAVGTLGRWTLAACVEAGSWRFVEIAPGGTVASATELPAPEVQPGSGLGGLWPLGPGRAGPFAVRWGEALLRVEPAAGSVALLERRVLAVVPLAGGGLAWVGVTESGRSRRGRLEAGAGTGAPSLLELPEGTDAAVGGAGPKGTGGLLAWRVGEGEWAFGEPIADGGRLRVGEGTRVVATGRPPARGLGPGLIGLRDERSLSFRDREGRERELDLGAAPDELVPCPMAPWLVERRGERALLRELGPRWGRVLGRWAPASV